VIAHALQSPVDAHDVVEEIAAEWATPEQVLAAAEVFLTTNRPRGFGRWLLDVSPEAKAALGEALGLVIECAADELRHFTVLADDWIRGPDAGMLSSLACVAYCRLPSNARFIAGVCGVPADDVASYLRMSAVPA
jgi:hypothetical protein